MGESKLAKAKGQCNIMATSLAHGLLGSDSDSPAP